MNAQPLLHALAALFLLAAGPLAANEEVVLGLSQNRVAITANFDGSQILVFGAVKRETPIPEEPLHVIVTVSGPIEPAIVRRKERVAGIWVNTQSVVVDAAPSFYAIATSAPWQEVISDTEDLRHKVSIPRAIRSVGAPMEIGNAQSFARALIRIRKREDLYQLNEETVAIDQQTLFRTSVDMPSNLTEGNYETRILLTRDRRVIASFDTIIAVNKVGVERFLFNLSREQPLIYGVLALLIAIAAGWGASAAFRLLRDG